MKHSPLAAAILHFLQTERGSLFLETLEADVLMLDWFKEFDATEASIEVALSELVTAGKVRRWTEDNKWVVEAIPESEWPKPKRQASLFA
jgi:hypothetical protein